MRVVSATEYAFYVLPHLMDPKSEDGLRYDIPVAAARVKTHIHRTEDGWVVRMVVPHGLLQAIPNPREVVYELTTSLLSETTNNDACDVWTRERSAHFDIHRDLDYLELPDDLSTIVVDGWYTDCLT